MTERQGETKGERESSCFLSILFQLVVNQHKRDSSCFLSVNFIPTN